MNLAGSVRVDVLGNAVCDFHGPLTGNCKHDAQWSESSRHPLDSLACALCLYSQRKESTDAPQSCE